MYRSVQKNHVSNPHPMGMEMGVQVQKYFIARNCMKYVDLHRNEWEMGVEVGFKYQFFC